ncbi:MAG: hypothetical protein P1V21_11350 [Rhizobiaceae bacterium]|nr:hypothetical protein [Rhizobiaceae bacterium]
MARITRLVVPGLPHHDTQRWQVLFEDSDYALYLDMLTARAARTRCATWALCQMPNHVPIILVPSESDGQRR